MGKMTKVFSGLAINLLKLRNTLWTAYYKKSLILYELNR